MSTILLSSYTPRKYLLKHWRKNADVLVNTIRINNIGVADYTIAFADSAEGLKEIVKILLEKMKEYGLEINEDKSHYMVIIKKYTAKSNNYN